MKKSSEDFLIEVIPTVEAIMDGISIVKPFINKEELREWCKENVLDAEVEIEIVVDLLANKYKIK